MVVVVVVDAVKEAVTVVEAVMVAMTMRGWRLPALVHYHGAVGGLRHRESVRRELACAKLHEMRRKRAR